MPSANVRMPLPLTRLPPWFPGQCGGVPGADAETGLRTHCTGTVFFVDPNYNGVTDLRDGTNPEAPLNSIAGALSKCQNYHGDVIVVMANDAWQYSPKASYTTPINETVVCTVSGVRIVGVSPSGALGVVWRPATAGATALTVYGCDVLVEGFCFDGFQIGAGGNGIYADWNGTTLWGENLTVRNCFFGDTIDTAIQLEYAWNCYIHDNVFQVPDVAAVYVDPAGSGIAYCEFADNWFHDCPLALSLQGCDNSVITRNHVYSSNAQGAAVSTNEGIDTTGGGTNLVTDNYLSCLLPVPANGDYNDFCSGAASDSWIANHCADGLAVTTPT